MYTHYYIRMEITVFYLKITQHQLSISWSQISVYWLRFCNTSKLSLRPSNPQLIPLDFQIQYSYPLIDKEFYLNCLTYWLYEREFCITLFTIKVYRTPYTWYFDPPTHGILTPYPWYFDPPTHGISSPLSMVFWPPCPWYFDPPTHGISNPHTHSILTPQPISWLKMRGVKIP